MFSNGPPHMAEQMQGDQLEPTYSSSVRIRDVALRTCQKRWTIERNGERGSGISVLAAWQDDDEISFINTNRLTNFWQLKKYVRKYKLYDLRKRKEEIIERTLKKDLRERHKRERERDWKRERERESEREGWSKGKGRQMRERRFIIDRLILTACHPSWVILFLGLREWR